jgi:MFS family permease
MSYLTSKRLPRSVAFPILAIALFSYFFAASAPSPAFVVLQQEWHFSASLLTIAFGVYAISLLFSLIVAGSISDYLGRRPVIFVALIIQALSMAMFFLATSIEGVIVARIVQGFATGIASGALSAAIVEAAPDHKKQLGAMISSISPLMGLAAGALVSGFAIKIAVHPISLVFGVLTILFLAGSILMVITPESVSRRPGVLTSMIPHISIPQAAKTEFWRGVPVLITTWSIGGLYLALIPSIIFHIFNLDSGLINGLTITVLSGVGALAPALLKRYPLPKAAMIGMVAVIVGVIGIFASLLSKSLILFFIATTCCGIGFGGAYSAIIQRLAPLVDKQDRAALFSVIFTVCYLALSVPAMAAGALVKPIGLLITTGWYLGIVLVISVIGLALQKKSLIDYIAKIKQRS